MLMDGDIMWKQILDFKSDAPLNGCFAFAVRRLQHSQIKTSGQQWSAISVLSKAAAQGGGE